MNCENENKNTFATENYLVPFIYFVIGSIPRTTREEWDAKAAANFHTSIEMRSSSHKSSHRGRSSISLHPRLSLRSCHLLYMSYQRWGCLIDSKIVLCYIILSMGCFVPNITTHVEVTKLYEQTASVENRSNDEGSFLFLNSVEPHGTFLKSSTQ